MEYRHSPLTLQLRTDFLESEYLFSADLAYMTALSSLHAHEKADPEKGCTQLNKLFLNALSRRPYLTGGKSGDQVIHGERVAAIEKYNKLRDRLIKVN